MPEQCKKCGNNNVQTPYSVIEESRDLVVVDKQTQQPLVLNEGDVLCSVCANGVDYYRCIRDC